MIYALGLFWQWARRLPMMTDSDRSGLEALLGRPKI
jgi:hypothetical protein